MTTATSNTPLDHTSDAGFRLWGLELSTLFAAVGLVQTADTGQVNWLTVTRPAINVVTPYEIWRCANSSWYMKVEYGTSTSANIPAIRITLGTGSNGSGTITAAVVTGPYAFTTTSAPLSTVTAATTYVSASNNHFSILWKAGSGTSSVDAGFFAFSKFVDTAGAYTTDGFTGVRNLAGTPNFFSTKLTGTTGNWASSFGATMPGDLAITATGGQVQVYHTWGLDPRMRPSIAAVVVRPAEMTIYTTFTADMVNSVNHTYLRVGSWLNGTNLVSGQQSWSLGILYE